MRLVLISDTHGSHRELSLPTGDILIHAGDFTAHGTQADAFDFLDWFSSQPHAHRICVAGNHDQWVEDQPERFAAEAQRLGIDWLNDSGCMAGGLSVWGSPITPRFFDWAFMRDAGEPIARHWDLIPAHTDLLITHGPPKGILDRVERADGDTELAGCPTLLEAIKRVEPRWHVFGHIHEGFGQAQLGATVFLNVSSMDQGYRLAHEPVIIDT